MQTMIKYYLAQLLLWTIISSAVSEKCEKNDCKLTRIKKMRTADCYHIDIHAFPKCLRSDIEILDLSYNRIRKLKKDDLEPYPHMNILYLSDNLISSIDHEFFDHADSLTVLDLSINDIRELPPNIFNLPSLSKLYLSQNANMNIVEVVESSRPITSPISRLDISFNELETLPNFGELIHLIEYNISGNNLFDLTPSLFAGLCNLKYLHNSNMTVLFESTCDCLKLNSWLTQREVIFKPFECEPLFYDGECNENINKEDLVIYNKCKETHQKLVTKSKLLKIVLPCSIVVIVIILGILYYLYKKKQKKARRDAALTANNSKKINNLLVCELKPLQKDEN